MANRSYLYSADSLPTAEDNPKRVLCISEHNWGVPLAHLLLAGRRTTVVPSMIWNPRIGIGADYAGGAALLADLLRAVGEGLPDEPEFAACAAKTLAHLEQQRQQYFVLETGEMVSLGDEDVEDAVRRLVDHDIPDAVAQAEAAVAGENDAWLAAVRAEWQDNFGSFYSTALYFSFPES